MEGDGFVLYRELDTITTNQLHTTYQAKRKRTSKEWFPLKAKKKLKTWEDDSPLANGRLFTESYAHSTRCSNSINSESGKQPAVRWLQRERQR